MTDNLYLPPTARVDDAQEPPQHEFYVVAPRKFVLLYIFTLGLYSIYWFYRNWSLQKLRRRLDVWPVPRSIFQIFFTHSLFRRIDAQLQQSGSRYRWKAEAVATTYVVLILLSRAIDRLITDESSFVDVVSLLMVVVPGLPLLSAQMAINHAENDAAGAGNSVLSAANLAWILAGALFWILMLIGVYMIVTKVPV